MSLTLKQHVDHWISSSDESLKDMEASFKSKRYLNALYCGHQSLEKIMKALLAARNERIVYLHNIVKLINACGVELSVAHFEELSKIDSFYISAKYGSVKSNLYIQCTPKFMNYWTRIIKKWRKEIKKQVVAERSKLPNNKPAEYPEDIY